MISKDWRFFNVNCEILTYLDDIVKQHFVFATKNPAGCSEIQPFQRARHVLPDSVVW